MKIETVYIQRSICKYMREKKPEKIMMLWWSINSSQSVIQRARPSQPLSQYCAICANAYTFTNWHSITRFLWSFVYVSPKPYISHVIRYFATFLRNLSLSISPFEQDPTKLLVEETSYNGYFVYFQEKCNCNLLCGWMMTTTGGKYFYITFFFLALFCICVL